MEKKNNSDKEDEVLPVDTMDWSMEQILRNNGKSEEEIQEYLKREESDDLLFEAYEAQTEEEALNLAKKALKIYPNNIDAQNLITQTELNPIKRLKNYKEILQKVQTYLQKEGVFGEKNIGVFWSIMETRPYMRTKFGYMKTLVELGRYSEAIVECEEMLKLCESDNLGIRYIIIGMYVFLERYEDAKKIFSKYGENDTHMLLPLSIMYYKQGEYTKCNKTIEKIKEENIFLYEVLSTAKDIDFDDEKEEELFVQRGMYSKGSKSEAILVLDEFSYLIESVPSYFEYVYNEFD